MIDKAWRAVTPLTIHSCFKKSGFPSPNLVEMDSTLTEFNAEPSLWEALPEQDLTFDDYVVVDTDIVVWGALSDAEIVALDHNNTESDEDESEELTSAGKFPSASEMLDKVLLYNKSCTKAYDLYGYIAEKEQNYRDAVKNFEKAWLLTSKLNPVIVDLSIS
ncbi:tetratricopeptide repeat protein 21B [Trichonephila clavipes]|nr:tetratricopeptide repeat protein 21B [Trichonephila clavipes]